jgi:hypothetical protein
MSTATAPYSPAVGDHFHKPAGTRQSSLDAEPVPTPERTAKVTMMSPGHVVVLIDGKEYTMPRGDFIRLAELTLANGSTLTRHS